MTKGHEMSDESAASIMDRAATAREVALLTALVLIRTDGNGQAALEMLDSFEGIADPQSLDELDAIPIAQEAIREALAMRGA